MSAWRAGSLTSAGPQSGVRGPLPLSDVTIDDVFWSPLRDRVHRETLPQQLEQLREPGKQLDALRLTWRPGDPHEPHIFWESDVGKWLEAASYVAGRTHDPDLDRQIDDVIALLADAQQPDGYLNTYFTVVNPSGRFADLRDAHELYCLGHLIEAAVAHTDATGKTSLLRVVERYADLVDQVFADDGPRAGGYCGHPEIELALVKLYRSTGERRYLDLAARFIRNRGQQPFYFETEALRRGTPGYFGTTTPGSPAALARHREYNQSHRPVVDQSDAVGHAVRAMYLFSAMADLSVENQDRALRDACRRLWVSVTERRMYVTGAIGSDPRNEGFSRDYDLPSYHGYGETCAAIGLMMFAARMANAEADARYVDVAEGALYNAIIGCASLDGTRYFYDNPLASDGSAARQTWFKCACCPPNFARLVSSLEAYVYSSTSACAVVNLYLSSRARFRLTGGDLVLQQDSTYLDQGRSVLTVLEAPESEAAVALRIPGWTRSHRVTLNDAPLTTAPERGYLTIRRGWSPGDRITLEFGWEPRLVWGHPAVADTAGRAALMLGPVVYCVEGVDHSVAAHQLQVEADATPECTGDRYGGLPILRIAGRQDVSTVAAPRPYGGNRPTSVPTTITAVPYYTWNNRGQSSMAVWIRTADGDATSGDPRTSPNEAP